MRSFNLGHSEALPQRLTADDVAKLGKTLMVSPRVGVTHGTTRPTDAEIKAGCEEVKRVTDDVKRGIYPGWFFKDHMDLYGVHPILTKYLGVTEVNFMAGVRFVANDHPFDFWQKVVETYAKDNKIPFSSQPGPGVPFLHSVNVRQQAHAIIYEGLNKAFDVKYFHMVCRPSEYFNESILLKPYECPSHPSFCAGHGAFFGSSVKAFRQLYSPTPMQLDDMKIAAEQIAHYRTLMGIHTYLDNKVGFDLGMRRIG